MFECEQPVRFRCVVISSYVCDARITTVSSYKLAHVSRALRALQESFKTSLRIDDGGLLSLQFLIHSPSANLDDRDSSFIDFRASIFSSSFLHSQFTPYLHLIVHSS